MVEEPDCISVPCAAWIFQLPLPQSSLLLIIFQGGCDSPARGGLCPPGGGSQCDMMKIRRRRHQK